MWRTSSTQFSMPSCTRSPFVEMRAVRRSSQSSHELQLEPTPRPERRNFRSPDAAARSRFPRQGLPLGGSAGIVPAMWFEKIWIEQCRATWAIKRRFGAKDALDYLVGEKLRMLRMPPGMTPPSPANCRDSLEPSGACSMSTSSRATSPAKSRLYAGSSGRCCTSRDEHLHWVCALDRGSR